MICERLTYALHPILLLKLATGHVSSRPVRTRKPWIGYTQLFLFDTTTKEPLQGVTSFSSPRQLPADTACTIRQSMTVAGRKCLQTNRHHQERISAASHHQHLPVYISAGCLSARTTLRSFTPCSVSRYPLLDPATDFLIEQTCRHSLCGLCSVVLDFVFLMPTL